MTSGVRVLRGGDSGSPVRAVTYGVSMGPLIWLIAAVVLAIAELAVMDLSLLMLAGAALVTSGVALAGVPVGVEVAVFAVAALLLFTLVRPVARRHLAVAAEDRRFTSRELEGRPAEVVAPVTGDGHDGRITVDGELWSARSVETGVTYAPGDRVVVVSIEGTTAVVWKGVS